MVGVTFKPMLAGKAPDTLEKLRYPVYVSPKLDGVRVIIIDGVVMSRNLKPIPNARVQRLWGRKKYNGLDGELIVGDPTDHDVFRNTTSGVMSKTGEPDVHFYVFDIVDVAKIFTTRLYKYTDVLEGNGDFRIVEQALVQDSIELDMYETKYLDQGYEGLMIRDPRGMYKFGRSTTSEGALLKLKRFEDSEAVIQDFEEQMHNDNVQQRDALGRSKRTSHKAGMVATGVLGALVVQDIRTKVAFNIGTGFSATDRSLFWSNRKSLLGLVVKYRYFPTGSKEKPRFPTFVGFRDRIDM